MNFEILSGAIDVAAFGLRKGRQRGARNTNAALKDEAAEEGAAIVRTSNVTRKQAAEEVIMKYRLSITADTMSRAISSKLV